MSGRRSRRPRQRARGVSPVDAYGIVDAVAELEGRMEVLVRWARAVRDLGGCCHDVSADGLAVIAEAMLADAHATKACWQRCFALACDLREHDRGLPPPPDPSPSRPRDHTRGDPAESGDAG